MKTLLLLSLLGPSPVIIPPPSAVDGDGNLAGDLILPVGATIYFNSDGSATTVYEQVGFTGRLVLAGDADTFLNITGDLNRLSMSSGMDIVMTGSGAFISNNSTCLLLGDAGTASSHSLGIGEVCVTDPIEFDGFAYFDAQAGFYGTDPEASSCGTTPTVTGADSAGKVTIGTGVTTSCTLTFVTAYTNAPACVVTGSDSAVVYAATSTTNTLVITSSADMASDVVMWHCFDL